MLFHTLFWVKLYSWGLVLFLTMGFPGKPSCGLGSNLGWNPPFLGPVACAPARRYPYDAWWPRGYFQPAAPRYLPWSHWESMSLPCQKISRTWRSTLWGSMGLIYTYHIFTITWWWFPQQKSIFTPKIGEDEPILTSIFFRWVGSTTNQQGFLCCHQVQIA